MNYSWKAAALALACLIPGALSQAAAPPVPPRKAAAKPAPKAPEPGRIIIEYRGARPASDKKASQSAPSLDALDSKYGLKTRRALGAANKLPNPARATAALVSRLEVLDFGDGADAAAIAKAYAADPAVARAEVDHPFQLAFTPNDTFFGNQFIDLNAMQFPEAWNIQKGVATVRVAVLDSGCDSHHPDLVGAIDPASHDFIANSAVIADNLGHGTRVASLIGATGNNAKGVAGAAYGVKLLILDVAGSGGAVFESTVIQALDYAVAQGARVANMSFVNTSYSPFLNDTIQSAAETMVLVASVGNDGLNTAKRYPAAYDNVIGVAATGHNTSARAPFSNYNGPGIDFADVCASGTTLFTCTPGGQFDGLYGSGTSFAAPLVSATAALLVAKYPAQSPASIVNQILRTTTVTTGAAYTTKGRVNAFRALNTPLSTDIQLFDVTVMDTPGLDPDNDGDGYLDKGETAKVVVTLKNNGSDVTALTAKLATTDPFVTGVIATNTATIGTLGFGAMGDNKSKPFANVVISASATARRVPFTLTLAGAGGFVSVVNFDLSTENEVPISGTVSNRLFENITTYRVTGDLTFDGGSTIPLGTRFKVDQGVNIHVGAGASLSAVGTADKPIVFTSSEPQKFYADPPYSKSLGPKFVHIDPLTYPTRMYVATTGDDTLGFGTDVAPYATIGKALIGSVAGGVVVVAAGEYHVTTTIGCLNTVDIIGGYNPATWQRDGSAGPTVLYGRGSVVVMTGADDCLLDGLVFTGGFNATGSGAGLICNNLSPTVKNCVFVNNYVSIGDFGGGGVFISTASPTFENCVFTGNKAVFGGGVYSLNSTPVFTRCVFSGNAIGESGALDISGGGADIEDCAVYGNSTTGFYSSVASTGANLTIKNTLLASGFDGADPSRVALYAKDGTAILRNNTLTQRADFDGVSGSVIDCDIANLNIPAGAAASTLSVLYNNLKQTNFTAIDASNITTATGPQHVGRVAWGGFTGVQEGSTGATSTLTGIAATLKPGSLAGHVVEVGTIPLGFLVLDNTEHTITVWGNAGHIAPGGGGQFPQPLPLPATFVISDFHLQRGSPLMTGGAGSNIVGGGPLNDIDGEPMDPNVVGIGIDGHSGTHTYPGWGGFTIDSGAGGVTLSHALIENGKGLTNIGSGTRLDYLTLFRNRGPGVLDEIGRSLAAPLTHSDAIENMGGGIFVNADVAFCTALRNIYVDRSVITTTGALTGMNISNCTATDNALNGVVATNASSSAATGNFGYGFWLLGGAGDGLTAIANQNGINSYVPGLSQPAQYLQNSTASYNSQIGIVYYLSSGVLNCTAIGNGGAGIYCITEYANPAPGSSIIQNCTVSFNGPALPDAAIYVNHPRIVDVIGCTVEGNDGTGIRNAYRVSQSRVRKNSGYGIEDAEKVTACYVAENGAGGIIGDDTAEAPVVDVVGCTVVLNQDGGIIAPETVTTSIIEDNFGQGVTGFSQTKGAVTDSQIAFNLTEGLHNIFTARRNNITDNTGGLTQASDDIGPTASVKNFTDNYWGGNNGQITAHPGDTTFQYPFLEDNIDHTGFGARLNVDPPHAEYTIDPLAADAAPPYANFVDVSPTFGGFVVPGLTTFTVYFNQQMDVTINPVVSFDSAEPYTRNVIAPAPGWTSAFTWVGTFPIDDSTGSGQQNVRVAGARAASGFVIPASVNPFTAFFVDTSGSFVANNGAAQLTGPVGRITWDGEGPAPRPAGAAGKGLESVQTTAGFNIVRSTDGLNYEQVNTAPVANLGAGSGARFLDVPLQTNSVYFWKVYRVLPDGSSVIWSGPFLAVTPATFDPTFVIDDATVVEGTGGLKNLVFTVKLYAPNGAASVNYSLAPGSALAGSDYTDTFGTLNFSNAATSQPITVPITTDSAGEPDENFTVTLSGASLGSVIGIGDATGRITDDDAAAVPRVSFRDDTAVFVEQNAIIGVYVKLDAPSATQCRVDYSTLNGKAKSGSDYIATTGAVIFNPGETEKLATVALLDDQVWEGAEDFEIRLDTPVHAQLVMPTAQRVTIIQPEMQPVLYFLLGLSNDSSNADINADGDFDAGDVVKLNNTHP